MLSHVMAVALDVQYWHSQLRVCSEQFRLQDPGLCTEGHEGEFISSGGLVLVTEEHNMNSPQGGLHYSVRIHEDSQHGAVAHSRTHHASC